MKKLIGFMLRIDMEDGHRAYEWIEEVKQRCLSKEFFNGPGWKDEYENNIKILPFIDLKRTLYLEKGFFNQKVSNVTYFPVYDEAAKDDI